MVGGGLFSEKGWQIRNSKCQNYFIPFIWGDLLRRHEDMQKASPTCIFTFVFIFLCFVGWVETKKKKKKKKKKVRYWCLTFFGLFWLNCSCQYGEGPELGCVIQHLWITGCSYTKQATSLGEGKLNSNLLNSA